MQKLHEMCLKLFSNDLFLLGEAARRHKMTDDNCNVQAARSIFYSVCGEQWRLVCKKFRFQMLPNF